jgi:hypothetical protein
MRHLLSMTYNYLRVFVVLILTRNRRSINEFATNGGTQHCSTHWTVERSCSLFQFKDFSVAAAGGADFGCEEFLEGNAFG